MPSIQPVVNQYALSNHPGKPQAAPQFGNGTPWETRDLNQALVSLLSTPLGARFEDDTRFMQVQLASVDRFLASGTHPEVVPDDRSRELCTEALGKITPLLELLQSIKGKLDTIKSRGLPDA